MFFRGGAGGMTSDRAGEFITDVHGAGGAEYRLWKELWIGADSRFHVASNQTNTVNNFWTAGLYAAVGF